VTDALTAASREVDSGTCGSRRGFVWNCGRCPVQCLTMTIPEILKELEPYTGRFPNEYQLTTSLV
jgi:hypothetical protein